MLCDICKTNVAKIHLTEIEGGKTKKVDLCESCSKEKGVEGSTSFALADMLLGLGASQEMAAASGGSEVKCKACGFSQADFKKSGRFGCAECTPRSRKDWKACSNPCTREPGTSARFRA